MRDLVGDLGGEWMDGWMDGWMTPFWVYVDGGVGVRRIIDLVRIHGCANIRTHIRMDVWIGIGIGLTTTTATTKAYLYAMLYFWNGISNANLLLCF